MTTSNMKNHQGPVLNASHGKPLLLLLALLLFLFPTGQAAPPNILLILADDMGYGDLSVQGCRDIQTPNIDSIAKNGARFKQAYVTNSVCAPSRAGILSGRIDIGFEANIPEKPAPGIGLDPELQTMADMLKGAGYATLCIGKWHLGETAEYHPNERGFDYFCGLRGGSRSYFYDEAEDDAPGNSREIEINGEHVKFDGYLTDYFTDIAVEQIESHTQKTPDQPFFMFLSYTAPHGPMHAKPEVIEKFTSIEKKQRRIYAAMMTSLDEGVGRVLATLEEKRILENTLVVFLSDNGGPTFKNGSYNGPLRGRKGELWEGGIRVPFLVQWPSKIPVGQVRDDQISSLDLIPTFAAVAGTQPVNKASGTNLIPCLQNDGTTVDERKLFWRRGSKKSCALRSGPYKWVENRTKNTQWLYNLEKDIGEKQNLIDELPEMATKLSEAYKKWESTVPDPAFDSGWNAAKEAAKQREQKKHAQGQ